MSKETQLSETAGAQVSDLSSKKLGITKNKSKIFAQKFHKKKQTFVSQKRKTIWLPYYFTTGGGGGKYHAKQRREAA